MYVRVYIRRPGRRKGECAREKDRDSNKGTRAKTKLTTKKTCAWCPCPSLAWCFLIRQVCFLIHARAETGFRSQEQEQVLESRWALCGASLRLLRPSRRCVFCKCAKAVVCSSFGRVSDDTLSSFLVILSGFPVLDCHGVSPPGFFVNAILPGTSQRFRHCLTCG